MDINDTGSAAVEVDGTGSHTHGTGLSLVSLVWKEGTQILGTGYNPQLTLPVGEHTVTLTVVDDGGNDSSESTTVTVLPFGYPAVTEVIPASGSIAGDETVTIKGSGFIESAENTIVRFGDVQLTGNELVIVDAFTIELQTPASVVGAPVQVSVETSSAESNAGQFTYIAGVPIAFNSGFLATLDAPASCKFGPDGKLYVGGNGGALTKITLNDDFTEVVGQVTSMVAQYRSILGIAFVSTYCRTSDGHPNIVFSLPGPSRYQ